MTMICFLRNYICDKYNTSFFDIVNQIKPLFNKKNKYYLNIIDIFNYTYISSLNNNYQDYINSVKMLTPSITSISVEKICNKLVTQEVENDNIFFIQDVENDELDNIIITNFVVSHLNVLFQKLGDNIQIIAYTNFLLNTAVENGINWYLCREKKMFNNKYPVKVDDDDKINIIEDYYKINIGIIEDNSKLVLTINPRYNKTLYIFKDSDKYYTILQQGKVALLDNNNIVFNKIPTISRGGASQKEQIDSIMNQSVLDNLLQNPNDDNNKHIISKNTLAYVVPIKIELYEGKDVPLSKKVESTCEENYNNILEAWKVLFKVDED